MVRNKETPLSSNIPSIKDTSLRIWRLLLSLILFISGIVLGLISSSHTTITMTSPSTSSHNPSFYSPYVTSVPPTPDSSHTRTCLGFRELVSPSSTMHVMSDEELYWRASLVPRVVDVVPFKRVPKVAFMFLSRGALPLLPMWERFFGGYQDLFRIYVHALPGFILNVSPDSVFFGTQIPSKKVYWGDVSMADAEKRLLANALLDFSNERFVLISESCIPIYNFKTVYKYLIESSHSFVESYDDPSRYGRGRYNKRMMPSIRLQHWRKGSQWFEMSRTLAVEIISDYKYFDLFRKYCHPSCYPDEHYIPTYLNMFHASLNSNRTVTYVDWSLGGPHPANFGRENITESFLQKIRNNGTECLYNSERTTICYLFARKFDPSALQPLLELSSKVMGF